MSLKRFIIFVCFILMNVFAFAQMRAGALNRMSGLGGRTNKTAGAGDSLQKRDQNADSITIFYKLYNSNEITILPSMIFINDSPFTILYTI
jgi:hypothetical protein